MIIKFSDLNKFDISKKNYYLFYGENEGLKNKSIKNFFIKDSKNIFRYDESEILSDKENFYNSIISKSLFEDEKLIIISRATDKFKDLIEEISEKEIDGIKIILNSRLLDKKSKLRVLFEKNKNTICIPFYADNAQTLIGITNLFFRNKKIPISQQTINLLVDRSRGDRQNLDNELNKIENYIQNKKSISIEAILKITNLAENYTVSELIDSCLSKNEKKTINILSENNYSTEDCILIIRTLLSKAKRIQKIQMKNTNNINVNDLISDFKPPIFWKDKDLVKHQINTWSLKNIQNLIYKINDIELLIKKNSTNSINILSDFIISKSIRLNN